MRPASMLTASFTKQGIRYVDRQERLLNGRKRKLLFLWQAKKQFTSRKNKSDQYRLQAGKGTEQGKKLAVKKIKTVERDKRTIKTGRVSEQVVKNTGKGTIKTSGKSVKTAEQTAKTSIKTSEQTANVSVRAMHYSMKKAEKAVQAARQTAQNTKIAVKTTAKGGNTCNKSVDGSYKSISEWIDCRRLDCSGDFDYRHFIWWISLHDRWG